MPPCLSDDLAVIQLAGRGDDLIAGAQGLCVPHALGGLHQLSLIHIYIYYSVRQIEIG